MSIKKLDDGRYEVDIRPQGRNGRRIRRKFDRKHEAVAYEKYVAANYHDKEWLSKPADKRALSELIDLWWLYCGKHAKYGAQDKVKLEFINKHLNDPCAFQLDKNAITRFRAKRLASGVKASTVNRNLIVLGGLFTFLIDGGFYHGEHPIRGIGKLKESETAMSFMSNDEIAKMLALLEGDNRLIAIMCLSTGGRWGEVTNLKAEHIVKNRVTFVETKGGKKRSVPISQSVADDTIKRSSGLLFPKADYHQFRELLKEVKPDLPKGQSLHVLRHTFATHFMMNGGNIITLQRILGHSSIQQTMVYAHFSPDFLQDAITFNPLKGNTSL